MEQELSLTPEVRDEMERYLASVAEALRRSGTAENEVQSVLQDVRNHVMEQLAARAPQAPTLQDVREVIAGMAPPESYAETPQPTSAGAAASPARGRYPLSENHRQLLMIFGFVLIAAALVLTVAGRRSLPVAVLTVIVGLVFVKWSVRGNVGSRFSERPQPAGAGAPPTEGRPALSDGHRRLLMVFGFILILAALGLTFSNEQSFPVAVLAIIVGLVFVKWSVRQALRSRASGFWSCLVVAVMAFAILVTFAFASYAPAKAWFGWPLHAAVQGSGRVITETRTVGGFSSISASGISVINVTQGEPQSLTIAADDNILPLIETEVKGDTLRVGYKGEHWGGISPTRPVTVNVTMKQISELEVSGSARIHAGSIAAQDLAIRGTGATEFDIAALTAQTLKVDLSGAGKCDIAGKVGSQVVHGTGSTRYSAGKLESLSAAVHISGAGNVTVWAKDALEIRASGASRVSYYGNPRVTQEVSGVSSITSLGNH